MNNEQTKKTDTKGTNLNQDLENGGQPLSEYEKTLALVERREAATKAEEKVLERKERLAANAMLGGTTGGNVPNKLITPEDQKKEDAAEYFKGTSLEKAIRPDVKK